MGMLGADQEGKLQAGRGHVSRNLQPLGRWGGVGGPGPGQPAAGTHLAWSATFSVSQRPCSWSISRTLSRSCRCSRAACEACCSRAPSPLLADSRRLESRFRQAVCRRQAVLAASARMSVRPLGDKGSTPS